MLGEPAGGGAILTPTDLLAKQVLLGPLCHAKRKGFRVRFSLPTKTGGYKDYYGQVHTDAGEADRDLD